MAEMSAATEQTADTTGHLRVVFWFGAASVVLLAAFLLRATALQPNWLVLVLTAGAVYLSCARAIRDLVCMKAGSSKEAVVQIGMAVITVLGTAAVLYFSWRYGAPVVVRALEAYLLPAFVPVAVTYVALALRVERKHHVRVFLGNRGWLFVPLPSNSTPHADAEPHSIKWTPRPNGRGGSNGSTGGS
jgi:hypothetical protein